MDLEQKMIQVLGALVPGAVAGSVNVFWDITPDVAPKDKDFIILSRAGGKAGWYMEQELPDAKNARVQVTGFSKRSSDREKLANRIEYAMCHAGFEACEPYGSWRGFVEKDLKLYACLWQFGVWHKPDVP